MFNPELRTASRRHRRISTGYSVAYTAVDFLAAVAFIVGSVFFFYAALEYAGTWLFLVGSILFAARPSVTLAREIHLSRLPVPKVPEPTDLPPVFGQS